MVARAGITQCRDRPEPRRLSLAFEKHRGADSSDDHDALRSPDRRVPGAASTTSAARDRGRTRDRRWHSRPPWLRHRPPRPPPGTRGASGQESSAADRPRCWRPCRDWSNVTGGLGRLAGEPHGLRLRRVFQLRRPDSPGRRFDGPAASASKGPWSPRTASIGRSLAESTRGEN